jgi:DNA-binding NarL/FixJ family response regulator
MKGLRRDQGLLHKEIADRLGLAIGTVRTHIARIYDKLHVPSRAEAMIKSPRRSPT